MRRFGMAALLLIGLNVGCSQPSEPGAPVAKTDSPKSEQAKKSSVDPWEGLVQGSGSLVLGKHRETLDIVEVKLQAGGRAELDVTGKGFPRTAFTGSWSSESPEAAKLKIASGMGGQTVDAEGVVEFGKGQTPSSLNFKGKMMSSGEDLTVAFKAKP